MASNYNAGNNCLNCSRKSSNGIIRDSMFYCSSDCYEKQKRVRFGKIHIVDEPHPTHTMSLNVYRPSSRMQLNPIPRPINKHCNYCFDQYDINIHHGIHYGRLWFCCQDHLNLANPRPKHVMVGPAMVPHIGPFIAPAMVHSSPIIMGPGLIGPFMGPFVGPPF